MTIVERMTIAGTARLLFFAVAIGIGFAPMSRAQENPFAPGWDLNAEASNIRFQSVKKQTKVESSSFATFSGSIEENGQATIRVLLDSVDTKIDLRNVRMRFLFFETFKFPEATITLQLSPEMITGLQSARRKSLIVPYVFNLHGVTRQMQAEIVLTLLTDDVVSVASAAPISIAVSDFDLSDNIKKLQEAAGGINIVPSATVTFDFLFTRRAGTGTQVAATQQTAPAAVAKPASVALETEGDFSLEACKGRFEILSRTGNIYFRSGSAKLDSESIPLLQSIVDIVRRCPGLKIEVAGHTDSDGGESANQRLSEARARSVADYLVENGIGAERFEALGYGETRPVVANDTAANKRRNRRIEFAVIGG